ncbi:M4 family metallopeptidase [Epilithonimonas zeae]|uniref:Por secretion system C-terminal sorting domain-containing protein n=1 Tax=Epilithonimonas zeae TaxID=1416779 RepID=A0A1N6E2M1_9FLAO|nr:M4 family metallopeptidase [Epilithonimonas zeae]SIN77234.1 Por secretion system C-terminal sorting domain-containing protein [Epilithonimonas zeae]
MKKELLRIGILCSIFGFTLSANAQEYVDKKITEKNGNVSLVTFKSNANLKSASKTDLFKEILKLPVGAELRLTKSEKDAKGSFLDEKYQLYYNNVKVEFGIYNLHYKNGNLTSMNGEIFDTNNVSISPKISSQSALDRAIQNVGAQKYMWDDVESNVDNYKKPTGELVLLPIQQADESYKLALAYKFDVFASKPMSRAYIYVDASSGQILLSDAIIKHAKGHHHNVLKGDLDTDKIISEVKDSELKETISKLATGNAATRYSGTQSIETSLNTAGDNYILFDTTRGAGVRTYNAKKSTAVGSAVDFTDADNDWTATEFDNSTWDNAALDAHFGVEKTYDYFKNVHNRDSYDNNGSLLRSYVHYGSNINNAYWSGSYMLYGDGDRTNNFNVLTAFDVTAHELGHGVCATSAALAYQRESGAMNEGLSDIWGAVVEETYLPNKQAFAIGEDITLYSPFYLRSMSNPKSAGQPDTYKGINWQPATAAEGCTTPAQDTNDYCGVHTNSGVLNHWYYVLVQGKTGTNDIGKSYSVTGIGFEKASKIVYRLETAFLSSNSTYMNARNFGIQVATELYGANSAEAIATQDAFYAVGLGAKYNPNGPDTIAPTTPLNLEATSTTNVSTYLTWDASTDNFALDGYNVYKDNVLLGTTYKTSYYVTGLSASTTYNFKVEAKDEAGNKSAFSNIVPVTTLATGNTYCTSQASNTSFMKIQNVKLNTIDNASTGSTGYEDFSYLSTDVKKGETYTITITPFWSGTVYPLRYRLYADYNNNGIFTDAGETAWSQTTATNAATVTGTFTIPATATTGRIRIRVQAAYSQTPTSCSTITYGQVEDYSLDIQEVLAVSDVNNDNKVSIYPNPVKDVLNIKTKESGDSTYKIFNTAGQSVANGKSIENKIDVNRLPTGNYVIELVNKKGEKSTQKFIKK